VGVGLGVGGGGVGVGFGVVEFGVGGGVGVGLGVGGGGGVGVGFGVVEFGVGGGVGVGLGVVGFGVGGFVGVGVGATVGEMIEIVLNTGFSYEIVGRSTPSAIRVLPSPYTTTAIGRSAPIPGIDLHPYPVVKEPGLHLLQSSLNGVYD